MRPGCSGMKGLPMRSTIARGRGMHIRINPINTIISLKSGRQSLSGGTGIPCQWFKASAYPLAGQTTTDWGPWSVILATWWHRPASDAVGGVWTKLQTNQPLAARR